MIIVIKSEGPDKGKKMDDLVALAKRYIEPGDLSNGGELRAQEASRLIDAVFDDPFLQKISTDKMRRLEKDVDLLGAERRQLVRIPEGQEPSEDDLASAYEDGDKLRALAVQLFPSIKLGWLRQHKDNPKLLQKVEQIFVKVMRRDFVDLGFNGVKDDASGATRAEKFVSLNKGWIQLAKDADKTPKLTSIPQPTAGRRRWPRQ